MTQQERDHIVNKALADMDADVGIEQLRANARELMRVVRWEIAETDRIFRKINRLAPAERIAILRKVLDACPSSVSASRITWDH